ncbi:hypothetical protein GCM10011409_18930 [Lentibacillus populi]|uniref:Uncharacterized protein n=1 Tax=Lentibacillus populi TaxID=1827502 RepID=A0A9W5TXQ4_9BACI|nr:YjcQ family protein [Lentibacillus populi]GGB41625.1 hypothetical protein GCM10011409_18930 [Lentibacillus populi]
MDEKKFSSTVLYILKELNRGNHDIQETDVGLPYEEFKELIDTMKLDKLIDGSKIFQDGMLDLGTTYITSNGRKYLNSNS